jgi:hypothetical protein
VCHPHEEVAVITSALEVLAECLGMKVEFDGQGAIYHKFILRGTTVNTDVYRDVF